MTQTLAPSARATPGRPAVESAAPGPGPILSEAWFATPRCVQQLLAQVDRVDVAAAKPQQTVAGKPQNTKEAIRIVDIRGPMLKYAGFWTWVLGGVSTFELRNEVNSAASDNSVAGIVLRIHSGGGEVAGTDDLALAVREASKRKPVVAFIEDMGASAACYVASQANRVVATESALVGSLGVLTVVTDASEAFKNAGLTVHVVATAELKGLGIAGRPISKADIEELKRIVEGARDLFMRRVVEGRRFPSPRARAVFDGRMFTAVEARELGLIDAVSSWESVLGELAASLRAGQRATPAELGAAIPAADFLFIREAWAARLSVAAAQEDMETARRRYAGHVS
jgi:signal peptide peptidase SppA